MMTTNPEELDALQERLENLRRLAAGPGDPIREPRRSHIARYHDALAKSWEAGAFAALRARVAELEAHVSDREAMHRRAQKAEGLLDRTMFILDGILKTYIYPETHLSLIKAIEAAHESVRRSSGRVFQMSHDFQRRNVQEAVARATAAEDELARRGQGVQVRELVWRKENDRLWVAHCQLGTYAIYLCDDGQYSLRMSWSLLLTDGDHETLEAAKAAAKADYEARIRAALVSPGEGWRELGAELQMIARSLPDSVSNDTCAKINRAGEILAPPASEPSEYEKKVAQMKEDFPNGI